MIQAFVYRRIDPKVKEKLLLIQESEEVKRKISTYERKVDTVLNKEIRETDRN